MKIAFFSDIHANLPALESFFKDLDRVQPDAVYCLGDLVGYNVWANEVVEEIRKRNIPTIMGNHDEALIFLAEEGDNANRKITRQLVSAENKAYLIGLPRHLTISFGTLEKPFNLLLVHGSPKSINDYLVEDYPEEKLLDLMEKYQADVVLCGHTHKPFHKQLKQEKGDKHVVNIGSVGKPKDGDPRICYVVLDIKETHSESPSISVAFRRAEYPVSKAAEAIINSEFPNEFADRLKQAK